MATSRGPRSPANISTATAKTRSLIQDLQTRLTEAAHPGLAAAPGATLETEEDLERQLEAYFAREVGGPGKAGASRARILDELRNRVIDGVVERILSEWSQPGAPTSAGLRDEVMERLIERVLGELHASGSLHSVRPS